MDALIAELQRMRDRIDDFEANHQAELSGQDGVDWWADDPRARAAST